MRLFNFLEILYMRELHHLGQFQNGIIDISVHFLMLVVDPGFTLAEFNHVSRRRVFDAKFVDQCPAIVAMMHVLVKQVNPLTVVVSIVNDAVVQRLINLRRPSSFALFFHFFNLKKHLRGLIFLGILFFYSLGYHMLGTRNFTLFYLMLVSC